MILTLLTILFQAIGEFLGTFLFLFFAFAGAQVANEADSNLGNSTPSIGTLLYISLAFGFSLAVTAWVFFRISGGLFNPAVTLGLMLIGCLSYTRAAVVILAQIIGAIASAGVVSALFPLVCFTQPYSTVTNSITDLGWCEETCRGEHLSQRHECRSRPLH